MQSHTPEIVITETVKWTKSADVMYTSNTDVQSDYFLASYTSNAFTWYNGKTNKVKRALDPLNSSYVNNCVDYIEFNNAKFATTAWIHTASWWNDADMVWLLNVSTETTFHGKLDLGGTSPAIVWQTEPDKWGATALKEPANGNYTGDVLLAQSPDGFYLYLYFMFTNGYVVGYQFDCIQI